MKVKESSTPWVWLDEFRGSDFQGEWPTLPELFSINAKRYSDRRCFEAFEPKHVTFTYGEALNAIKKVALALKNAGIKDGDRVGVVGKNSPEWTIAYLGILFAN